MAVASSPPLIVARFTALATFSTFVGAASRMVGAAARLRVLCMWCVEGRNRIVWVWDRISRNGHSAWHPAHTHLAMDAANLKPRTRVVDWIEIGGIKPKAKSLVLAWARGALCLGTRVPFRAHWLTSMQGHSRETPH
jgi:hypothetical protein